MSSVDALEIPLLSQGPEPVGLAEFHEGMRAAGDRIYTHTERIALDSLDNWYSDPENGWIRHRTGKFFSIEGLRASVTDAPVPGWFQPIINQPETGILGILVREFDGVPHLLMQLKAEPGNRGGLQISPTVQATRSNFTGVHGGKAVPYLDHFRNAPPDRVLADVRQSEQGAWFLRKRNRNMIVTTTDDVEVLDGFVWLSLGQVLQLLRRDDLINMDTRTVLSCLPFAPGAARGAGAPSGGPGADSAARYGEFTAALLRSCDPAAGSHHPDGEIRSWITEVRSRTEMSVAPAPLGDLAGWRRRDGSVRHESGGFFEVIGVRVESAGREVGSWTQPMLTTGEDGLHGLLVTRIGGVLHALMHLRVEPGLVDVAELAPTVQCTPGNYAHLPAAGRPAFLDEVLGAPPEAIRFDTALSDEGGRFYQVSNRHLIVETGTVHRHPDYRWMPVHQLAGLLRHCHYLNVQARSLVACLYSLLAGPAAGTTTAQEGSTA